MTPSTLRLSHLVALTLLAGTSLAQEDATADQGITWNDLVKGGSSVRLYGFLRLDAMHDDSRMNDPQIPIFVRSEDASPPVGAPAGAVAPRNEQEFTMSARLTRLGLELKAPPIGDLGDPELTGKLEVDFYNIGLGDSDSREAIRMRLAYLELDWGDWSLLAGQDWDVISPLYPTVNNDIVMWGAGNTGDRRPQITLKNVTAAGPGRIVTEVSALLAGAVGGATTFGGLRSGEASGRPMFQARVGYHGETESGGKYQLGVWGHDSDEQFDATGAGEQTFDSHSVGVDARIPLHGDGLTVQGEYWTGQDLTDIRGGILQGVNPTTGEEIHAHGGFVELAYQATAAMTLYAGYTLDDPDDSDLDPFQRAKNSVPYVAARWRYGALRFGLEYLNWTTEYVGLSDGTANRVVGWIAYYL